MNKTIQLTEAERSQLFKMINKDQAEHGSKEVWQSLYDKLKG